MGIHVCVGVHVLAQTGLTKYNLMSIFAQLLRVRMYTCACIYFLSL